MIAIDELLRRAMERGLTHLSATCDGRTLQILGSAGSAPYVELERLELAVSGPGEGDEVEQYRQRLALTRQRLEQTQLQAKAATERAECYWRTIELAHEAIGADGDESLVDACRKLVTDRAEAVTRAIRAEDATDRVMLAGMVIASQNARLMEQAEQGGAA